MVAYNGFPYRSDQGTIVYVDGLLLFTSPELHTMVGTSVQIRIVAINLDTLSEVSEVSGCLK